MSKLSTVLIIFASVSALDWMLTYSR